MKKREISALVPIGESFEMVDPSDLKSISTYFLIDNLGIKLLHVNAKNDYEHILADKISFDDSKKVVTIRIKDALFSDGSTITSNDVLNTLKRLIVVGSAHIPIKDFIDESCHISSLDQPVECFVVIDPKTIQIKLKKITREFLYYLTLADSVILHPSQIKSDRLNADDWKVSSGAYILQGLNLVKNTKALNQSEGTPDLVRLIPAKKESEFSEMKRADIGYSMYMKKPTSENVELPEDYKFAEDGFNFVTYLAVNTKNKKFKKDETRQWLNMKIQTGFLKNLNESRFIKKANQFFLDGSIAYSKYFDFSSKVKVPEAIPEELRNGISILTVSQVGRFVVNDIEKDLQRALGIPVRFEMTDTTEKYRERNQTRDFEIYFIPTSTSYHVATESLNLLYKSNRRMVDNPNGKVLELIDQYQQFKGNDREVLDQIVVEMAKESEVIPLYYLSSPKFYNSKTVDITDMNPNESMTFWKVRVL